MEPLNKKSFSQRKANVSTKVKLLMDKLFEEEQADQPTRFNQEERNILYRRYVGKPVKYHVNNFQKLGADEKQGASKTFSVKTQEEIGGKFRVKTNKGIAKESVEYSTSAGNLGLVRGQKARMLARQVATWKVARALDTRVIAHEKYALHDNRLMGISAVVPGATAEDKTQRTTRSLGAEMNRHIAMIEGQGYSNLEVEDYFKKNVFTGEIQRQLSDLQLIDALTGQSDRHHFNIYIDTTNEKIYGIDNDQSFVNTKNRSRLNQKNSAVSFFIPEIAFGKDDFSRDLKYTQSQIDAETAKKVLAMTPESLRELLDDKVGRGYGEYLDEDEIEAAENRLKAIQDRIRELDSDGMLIRDWNDQTFMDSVDKFGGILRHHELDNISTSGASQGYQNYVAREMYMSVFGATENGSINVYELGKTDAENRAYYGDIRYERHIDGIASKFGLILTHKHIEDNKAKIVLEEKYNSMREEWEKNANERLIKRNQEEDAQKARVKAYLETRQIRAQVLEDYARKVRVKSKFQERRARAQRRKDID